MVAQAGLDSAGSHFGQNIYQSTFDSSLPGINNIPVKQYKNQIGQGINTNILLAEIKISYLINEKNNLRAEGGVVYKQQKSVAGTKEYNYFYVGIRTSVFKGYYDY